MDKPKYIDLEKLTARLPILKFEGDYYIPLPDVRKAVSLAAAETGDVVEVVRCKDCLYRPYHVCTRDDRWRDEDDFCSRGKRKEQT